MSIPGSASPLFLSAAAAAEPAAFQIDRSLRFNSADSASLSKTFSAAGNRKKWTWSAWIKRCKFGVNQRVFSGISGSGSNDNYMSLLFDTDDTFRVGLWTVYARISNAVFRDPSAWYHFTVAADLDNSDNALKLRAYVNNSEISWTSTGTNPSTSGINGSGVQSLGADTNGTSNPCDIYLADVYFIDGQALAPTDFGEYDNNNNWNPKEFSGTYGTNGFYLNFSDNSSNAALGDDSSGNNNDWTVNNLVATAGLETASQGMDVVTYTGNGSTQSISNLEFQPDFVWIKQRNTTRNHGLYDIVRGATKRLTCNGTNAEITDANLLTSFDSNGFSVGSDSEVNESSGTYVAWCWKAGGTASSNTDGSITSSVSVNTTYGFSIVSYSGANSVSTVGHGLGAAPEMFVVKRRSPSGYGWIVYHSAMGASNMMALQNTSAAALDFDPWDQTAPNSSVFTVNTTGSGTVNASGADYIAYCWSEVSGFSKFGSFTHSSTTSLNFGFKPKYWLIKETDGTTPWYIFDAERDNFDDPLFANTTGTAGSGFAITVTDTGISWVSGSFDAGTYIYAAFAAKPPGEIIDSLIDTPTNYDADSGNNGGNYATLNPLSKGSAITLANGNLDISAASSGSQRVWGTIGVSTGKWYFEFTQSSGTYAQGVGIKHSAAQDNNDNYFYTGHTGQKVNASGTASSYGATWGINDVIGVAFDLDAGTITFYKNGVSQGQAFSGITDATYFPYVSGWSGGAWGGFVNFGQRPFAYTPPTGFLPLVTTSLPDPTIADGSTAFDAKTYSGTGSSNSITGLNFSPDFVWIKRRDTTSDHNLQDIIRGTTSPLYSNLTNAEGNFSQGLTAFNSDGFTVGTGGDVNNSSGTYVAWTWDAGTSTATNTDGSVTTNVRANQSAGFSIVEAPSLTTGVKTLGHGLNAVPEMIWMKRTSASEAWYVYHVGLTSGKMLRLNDSTAEENSFLGNSTLNTSVFNYDPNTGDHIAYCFAPVAGYSAMGSWTAASAPVFVYTGFRPAFVLGKSSTTANGWWIRDNKRLNDYNPTTYTLFPDTNQAERNDFYDEIDFVSNGFVIRATGTSNFTNVGTMIYAAFAEHPFKTARAR